jgi:CRISPR-associated protein Cpf1
MQIRNSDTQKNDFILSAVEKDWVKFDSRRFLQIAWGDEMTNSIELPTSGDANWAYNIARKGKMMIERILRTPDKPDLYIKDVDWDEFVTI